MSYGAQNVNFDPLQYRFMTALHMNTWSQAFPSKYFICIGEFINKFIKIH